MKYDTKLGVIGNLERSFVELNKTNQNIYNNKSEADRSFYEVNESLAMADETAIELFEAQIAQDEINAAQDNALIEIYEMVGGI